MWWGEALWLDGAVKALSVCKACWLSATCVVDVGCGCRAWEATHQSLVRGDAMEVFSCWCVVL